MNKTLYKNIKSILLIGASCSILASCSINPTPSKSFGLPPNVDVTNDIIHRTRCEARDTMILAAAQVLEKINDSTVEFISKKNGDGAEQIIKNLRENPSNLRTYKEWELPPVLYIVASPILRSSLGLDFTFTITENNNDSFSPELTNNVGSNTFSLDIISNQLNRSRQNLRLINVKSRNFDTFQNLICDDDKVGEDDENRDKRRKTFEKINPIYPLKGNIQLYKTIGTFINFIHLDANKSEKGTRRNFAKNALTNAASSLYSRNKAQIKLEDKSQKASNAHQKAVRKLKEIVADIDSDKCVDEQCRNARTCYGHILSEASDIYMKKLYSTFNIPADKGITMSDTLKFRTEISGGLKPKIVYGTPSSLDLEAAAFSFNPSRVDIHQVKVSMTGAIPPKAATKAKFTPILTGANGNQFFQKNNVKAEQKGTIEECKKYESKEIQKLFRNVEKKMVVQSLNGFPIVQDTNEVKALKQESEILNNNSVAVERIIQSGVAVPLQ